MWYDAKYWPVYLASFFIGGGLGHWLSREWAKRLVNRYIQAAHLRRMEGSIPSHCFDCGCYLMGGMTQHKPGCSIGKIIEDFASGKITQTAD